MSGLAIAVGLLLLVGMCAAVFVRLCSRSPALNIDEPEALTDDELNDVSTESWQDKVDRERARRAY